MNRLIYFLMLMCSTLFWSCESMVNDLGPDKLPNIESKLAVECYISPQSEEIMVRVTESQPLFGPSTYRPIHIKNATVTISGDIGSIQIPYYDSTSYRISTEKFKIEAGKKYELVVTDGKRTVKASCVVPAKLVQLKSYAIDTVFNREYEGDTSVRVKIAWHDIKGESNYYMLRGYVETEITLPGFDEETGWMQPKRMINKSLFSYDYQDNIWSDTNVDGITFESPTFHVRLERKFYSEFNGPQGEFYKIYSDPAFTKVQFEILNLDENYYRFFKSVKGSRDDDNPFIEPTLTYSNVEGGLGCFGAYNNAIFSVTP